MLVRYDNRTRLTVTKLVWMLEVRSAKPEIPIKSKKRMHSYDSSTVPVRDPSFVTSFANGKPWTLIVCCVTNPLKHNANLGDTTGMGTSTNYLVVWSFLTSPLNNNILLLDRCKLVLHGYNKQQLIFPQ